jgi:hypothetical protein
MLEKNLINVTLAFVYGQARHLRKIFAFLDRDLDFFLVESCLKLASMG